jgi:hypothetical protein
MDSRWKMITECLAPALASLDQPPFPGGARGALAADKASAKCRHSDLSWQWTPEKNAPQTPPLPRPWWALTGARGAAGSSVGAGTDETAGPTVCRVANSRADRSNDGTNGSYPAWCQSARREGLAIFVGVDGGVGVGRSAVCTRHSTAGALPLPLQLQPIASFGRRAGFGRADWTSTHFSRPVTTIHGPVGACRRLNCAVARHQAAGGPLPSQGEVSVSLRAETSAVARAARLRISSGSAIPES